MASKRKQWSDESMKAAVQYVQSDGASLRESARLYNVPLESLRRRVHGTVEINCRPGPKTVLTEEEEGKLADYLVQMSEMGYGLTREGVMGLAFSIAEKSRRSHPFHNGSAGRAWFDGFMRRRPNLTIRSPQPLSYCRAVSANRDTVRDFFGKLGALYGKLNLVSKPMQIYNCDETGISIVFKPKKVIAELGKRNVYSVSSAEKGRTHTVLSCVSATGFVVPPMMIYPRKTSVPEKLKVGAFPNTCFRSSENGWVNKELFVDWFQFFLKSIPPSRPVLLIQDGHGSHVSIELIEMARENDVSLLCLPSHTSHILQPLDVGVFKSFKSGFSKVCGDYMKHYPGRVITADLLASMVGLAYPISFTPVNILSGFRKTGIYPFNPSAIDDRQMAPSNAVSKKKSSQLPATPLSPASQDPTSLKPPSTILFSPAKERLFEKRYKEGYDINDAEYIAWVKINHPDHCLSVASGGGGSSSLTTSWELRPVTTKDDAINDSNDSHSVVLPKPTEVDLQDILVLPNPDEKQSKRKRKPGVNTARTVCLTDTPIFCGLKDKEQEKKEKEQEKLEKKRIREEKKAQKEKSRGQDKSRKNKAAAKEAVSTTTKSLEATMEKLNLDTSSTSAEDEEAICPICSKTFSDSSNEMWVCCDKCSQWYDFRCTKLRSKKRIPEKYICPLCQ